MLCRVIDDGTVSVNGKQIKIVSNRNPLELPWGEMVRPSLVKMFVQGTEVQMCKYVSGSKAAADLLAPSEEGKPDLVEARHLLRCVVSIARALTWSLRVPASL